jgi:hypothetical protein
MARALIFTENGLPPQIFGQNGPEFADKILNGFIIRIVCGRALG